MNRKEFPALFSYEKLTDSEQTSINHILQRLAEYNTMYKQMCACKKENTKLQQEKQDLIDYLKEEIERLNKEINCNKISYDSIQNAKSMKYTYEKVLDKIEKSDK